MGDKGVGRPQGFHPDKASGPDDAQAGIDGGRQHMGSCPVGGAPLAERLLFLLPTRSTVRTTETVFRASVGLRGLGVHVFERLGV